MNQEQFNDAKYLVDCIGKIKENRRKDLDFGKPEGLDEMKTFKQPVWTEEEKRDRARMGADVELVTSKMAEWRRSLDFLHYDFSSCMETWAWEIRNLRWRMDTDMPLVDVFTNIWYLEWQPSYTFMDDPTYKPDLARWHRSQNLGK